MLLGPPDEVFVGSVVLGDDALYGETDSGLEKQQSMLHTHWLFWFPLEVAEGIEQPRGRSGWKGEVKGRVVVNGVLEVPTTYSMYLGTQISIPRAPQY